MMGRISTFVTLKDNTKTSRAGRHNPVERKAKAMTMKERLKVHTRIEKGNAIRFECWRKGIRRKRKAGGNFRGCVVSVGGWVA